MKSNLFLIVITAGSFAIYSCSDKNEKPFKSGDFEIKEFHSLKNIDQKNNVKELDLDYTESIDSGFFIPTVRQLKDGVFTCSFSIKNTTPASKRFAWKIYYKNESYSFPEIDSTTGNYHELAEENFYGSYLDSSIGFRHTEEIPADNNYHVINDYIVIAGNPRHQEEFFKNGKNDRWERNPRVGKYSFMLVVTEDSSLSSIPSYVQNICLKQNEKYISPFYYFNYGAGKKAINTIAVYSTDTLKVVARPDLGKGIYISDDSPGSEFVKNKIINHCGNDPSLYKSSAFSQFYHYIDKSTQLANIPVIDDVLKNNYSQIEYNWNRSFYSKEDLIKTTPVTARIPCETVYSDPINKKIIIHNPKSTFGKWKKENVGVITRNGLTYGKWRVKAKLTELMNKNNMWNGLTNAIWLIGQFNDGWNLRRPCNKEGYMKTYWGGTHDERVNRVDYSEIDFEILKTPPYCPEINFPPVYRNSFSNNKNIDSWNIPWPEEITHDSGNITVACTNWDMACWEPKDFGIGCNPVSYKQKTFEAHRWDKDYRALTEKTPAPDDELFGSKYYYFEIDWEPTEITWRIGPEPDKMFVVGYMNDKITSIPDNQMLLIITQEFHNTKWWPGSPYQQENIPFPLNDIFGEIYEVVVE
jgi:hypothetical protein